MTTDQNFQDDQDWLDALAGKPRTGADPLELAHAATVRRALTAHRDEIEADANNISEDQIEKLRSRLLAQGLLKVDTPRKRPGSANLPSLLGIFGKSNSGETVSWQRWVVVALISLVIVVAIGLKVSPNSSTDAVDVMRGGTATVLIVEDANTRLRQITAGLDAAKAKYAITQLSKGRIQIDIEPSTTVLDYLGSQHIEPVVKDNSIRIIVQPN